MVEIRKQEKPAVSDIEKIEIEIDQLPLDAAGIKEPANLHEGRFSIYFLAALALIDGSVTMENLTEEKVSNLEIDRLRRKITAKGFSDVGLSARVRVIMKDGTMIERYTPSPKGSSENPLTPEELKNKFQTTSGMQPNRNSKVIEKVMEMEKLSSMTGILSQI